MIAMFASAVPAPAAAQAASFPSKPIRIVIPFAAGGFADITMRVLADKLGERLSQRVIIENRPGGGGVVAAQAVTSSPADGYTLFVLAVGTAISVALFKSLPFDALKDFAPISTVAHFDMLLLTKSSSPIRTLDDLLADARKRGEGMNLGTTLAGARSFWRVRCSARWPASRPPRCRSARRPTCCWRCCAATSTSRSNPTAR
jgi:tripartite-type tricarboxylate transporter receptor subunit TctC